MFSNHNEAMCHKLLFKKCSGSSCGRFPFLISLRIEYPAHIVHEPQQNKGRTNIIHFNNKVTNANMNGVYSQKACSLSNVKFVFVRVLLVVVLE